MEEQPIKLIAEKDEDGLSIYENTELVEKINIKESVDFRETIERLLKDNFENKFLLEKGEGDFDTVEQDAIDFLLKVINTYNEKVQEWKMFKAEAESSLAEDNL